MTNLETFIKNFYYQRSEEAIKSDFGKALIIAGSLKYPGAAFLATTFANLAPLGYLGIMVPNSIYLASLNNVSFNVIHELSELENDFKNPDLNFNYYDSILFGNGVNNSLENETFLKYLLLKFTGELVIDATGLSLLKKNIGYLLKSKANILLTPHLKELSELLDINLKGKDATLYLNETINFAKKYKVNILIKSYNQILVLKEGSYLILNTKKTSALAKAGSGDCLAGLLTGFLAYKNHYQYEDIISFVAELYNKAAYESGQNLSPGLVSYIDIVFEIKKKIEDRK